MAVGPGYNDNWETVQRELRRMKPKRRVHTLTEVNTMEYARYLQEKKGFFVFNAEHLVQLVVKKLQAVLDAGRPLTDQRIKRALDAAGAEDINWLRSLTGQMRPPVRAGEGPRRARQGGWSDVTGNLAAAYRHKVD